LAMVFPHGIESFLTTLGGFCLVCTHVRNYRLCRSTSCSHAAWVLEFFPLLSPWIFRGPRRVQLYMCRLFFLYLWLFANKYKSFGMWICRLQDRAGLIKLDQARSEWICGINY
jgi:hypothetical protein